MRKWSSVFVVVAALVAADFPAGADTPPDIYNDYAQDGELRCGHSREALKKVLNDASIHQYADPALFVGLKLAVRKQLAGACNTEEQAAPQATGEAPGTGEGETPPASQSSADRAEKGGSDGQRRLDPANGVALDESVDDRRMEEQSNSGQNGWIVALAVGLLLTMLGSGGWAARRAFTDRT